MEDQAVWRRQRVPHAGRARLAVRERRRRTRRWHDRGLRRKHGRCGTGRQGQEADQCEVRDPLFHDKWNPGAVLENNRAKG